MKLKENLPYQEVCMLMQYVFELVRRTTCFDLPRASFNGLQLLLSEWKINHENVRVNFERVPIERSVTLSIICISLFPVIT